MDEVAITNIVLSCLSFLLACLSIVFVWLTIRQNNKMIENSTRPYVVITTNKTTFGIKEDFYLIIKNYGKSGAIIKSLKCDVELSKFSFIKGKTPFGSIQGTYIAPNQSFISVLDTKKINEGTEKLKFTIEYEWGKRHYQEEFIVNYAIYKENQTARTLDRDDVNKTIAKTLQDLVEKHF